MEIEVMRVCLHGRATVKVFCGSEASRNSAEDDSPPQLQTLALIEVV